MATAVAAVADASCGSGGTTGNLTADMACADVAHAGCTRLLACSATALQVRYGDEKTCEMREEQSCIKALAAPGNGNDATHTEACAQDIPAWACPDYLNGANTPAGCTQQAGTGATGESCAFPGQCQSGFCAVAPGIGCGICAPRPTVGAACAGLTTCGQGLICTSDTQTCVTFATTVAAPCGPGAPCGAGLSCIGATGLAMGTCRPSATQAGATCDPTLKTGPGCDRNAGLVCNSHSKECAPATVAVTKGSCGVVDNQTVFCAASGSCKNGICVAAAADGAACDTANGPGCEQLARCIVGSGSGTAGTCHMNELTLCPAAGPTSDGGTGNPDAGL
jgi:hypothetical protein